MRILSVILIGLLMFNSVCLAKNSTEVSLGDPENKNLILSKVQITELQNLSDNFKIYLIDYVEKTARFEDKILKLETEQKNLNLELVAVKDELTLQKTKAEEEKIYLIVGGMLLALLTTAVK